VKSILLGLIATFLLGSSLVSAAPRQTGGGCTSKNDVPGDFVNQCALAGGTEVRCSSGTPMCCIKDAAGTRCYDTISDVKRKAAKVPAGPTPGKLAPPTAPKTAPKQKAPGTAAPIR
jgi:hypothetical protein